MCIIRKSKYRRVDKVPQITVNVKRMCCHHQCRNVKMDFVESACSCVAIQFEKSSQYCEINLTNLTPESFFKNVVSVVPEAVSSAKAEIFIYDDRNVLVPMNLLSSVILQRMDKENFHLRIIRGKWHQRKIKLNRTSKDCEDQEFRSYLIIKHLKHIVSKGETNTEALDDNERIAIIRAGDNYLLEKFGTNKNVSERKSLSVTINKLFPQLSSAIAFKKLSMKLYNIERKSKKKSTRKKVEVPDSAIEANDDGKPLNGLNNSNSNDTAEQAEIEYLDDDGDIIYNVDSDEENGDESEDGKIGMYSVT